MMKSPRQIQFATQKIQSTTWPNTGWKDWHLHRMAAVGWWKVPRRNLPTARCSRPCCRCKQQPGSRKGEPCILESFSVSSHLSFAPAYAVVGTADPVAARLWYMPMGLAVVKATSLVSRTHRGISFCKVGHLAIESSPRVGEVKWAVLKMFGH